MISAGSFGLEVSGLKSSVFLMTASFLTLDAFEVGVEESDSCDSVNRFPI